MQCIYTSQNQYPEIMVEEWFHARPCAVSFVTENMDGSCWADSFIFALMYPTTLRTFMKSFFTFSYDLEGHETVGDVINRHLDRQYMALQEIIKDIDKAIEISAESNIQTKVDAFKPQHDLYKSAFEQLKAQRTAGRNATTQLVEYVQQLVTLYETDSFKEEQCPTKPPGRKLYELMFHAVTGHEITTAGGWKFLDVADVFDKGLRPSFMTITLHDACDLEYIAENFKPSEQNDVLVVVNNRKVTVRVPQDTEKAPYVLQGNNFKYVCRSAVVRSPGHAMAFGTCDDMNKEQKDTTWVFFDGQDGGFLAYGGYGSFPHSAFLNPLKTTAETYTFGITYKATDLNVFRNDSIIIYQRLR